MLDKGTKIIIGAAVTSLMALGAHTGLGTGSAFVERLEEKAQGALEAASIPGVEIAMEREPTLTRNIILSGDESKKEDALAAVSAIPGVGSVSWAGDEGGDGAGADEASAGGDSEAPASAAAVAQCQSDVDTLMQGKTINFNSGGAWLAPDSVAIIDDLAKTLQACSAMQVEIQGHTDLTGNAVSNQNLSQERADRVRNALVERGVPGDRLTSKGYGSSQPLEEEQTSAANAKNRRTVFVVSSGAATNNGGE